MNIHTSAAEGKSAEQTYAEKLHKLSLTESGVQDAQTVIFGLLTRCTLWIQIIREKFVLLLLASPKSSIPLFAHLPTLTLPANPIDKARSTSASKTPTTNCSKSATPWTR